MKMRPKLASENEVLALESFWLLKLGMQMSQGAKNQLRRKEEAPQIHCHLWDPSFPLSEVKEAEPC